MKNTTRISLFSSIKSVFLLGTSKQGLIHNGDPWVPIWIITFSLVLAVLYYTFSLIMASDCEAQGVIWSYSSGLLSSLLEGPRPEAGFVLHDVSMQVFLGSGFLGSFNLPPCHMYPKIRLCFLLNSISQLRPGFNNDNVENPNTLGNRLKSFIFP